MSVASSEKTVERAMTPCLLMPAQQVVRGSCLGGWLAAAAALERTGRALGDAAAVTAAHLQPTAEALGASLQLSPEDTALFSEEVRVGLCR